ncbi:MAG: hypothetical protein LBI43_04000 [Streptococcaceae bacterium]|jgi:hypothetical protein|nr:hypothetical protein [Streptococcaceae bacterium]
MADTKKPKNIDTLKSNDFSEADITKNTAEAKLAAAERTLNELLKQDNLDEGPVKRAVIADLLQQIMSAKENL